jgi:hypothetical protein
LGLEVFPFCSPSIESRYDLVTFISIGVKVFTESPLLFFFF